MNFRKLSAFNIYTQGIVEIAWKISEIGMQMATNREPFAATEVKQLYDKVLEKYPHLAVDSNDSLGFDAAINIRNIFPFILAEANKIIDERPLSQETKTNHPASG